jgi:superfamily I DNA/RNA helicase/Zn-dependent peptidase ImmA (M78 family)
MQALAAARARAQEVRVSLSLSGTVVAWADLVEYCKRAHRMEVVRVAAAILDGAMGILDKDDGIIQVDEALAPEMATATLAHEIGHLELHARRLDDPTDSVNPIMASVYADGDAIGVARYSPRMREEIEAEAFAIALLCPPEDALAHWLGDPSATGVSVASLFGVTLETAYAQLASGVYIQSLGKPQETVVRPLVEPDSDQRAAICHTGHHALVDAGPGTGKTATLVHRACYLVRECGVAPEHILVVTFSNEAAEEVRLRLTAAIGSAASNMSIHTFHAFGADLLHVYHEVVHRTSKFALLDDEAQLDFISRLIGRPAARPLVNVRDLEGSVEHAAKVINYCSGRLISCDDLDDAVAAWTDRDGDESAHERAKAIAALYRIYEDEKGDADCVDFNDLIALSIDILQSGNEALHTIRATYKHILVDEFQDVTPATARLIAILSGEDNPVWVVGDARQAIYRFLGASAENITQFSTLFPDATPYSLRTNYRASPEIVTAANELATLLVSPGATAADEKWRPCVVEGQSSAPGGIAFAIADSDGDETVGIVSEVVQLIASGVAPEEISVLARRNEDVRRIAVALANCGIEVSANNLLSADGLAGDLIALASIADDPTPTSTVRTAIAVARGRLSASETNRLVTSVLSDPAAMPGNGLDAARASVDELVALAKDHRDSGDGFDLLCRSLFDSNALLRPILSSSPTAQTRLKLSEIASVLALAVAYRAGSRDEPPHEARLRFAASARRRLAKGRPAPVAPAPARDSVRVMTCHAAKGLEFPHVLVAGQSARAEKEEYPELPVSLRPPNDDGTAQANALLFVAVTRAKRSVRISRAMSPRGITAVRRGRPPVALLADWTRMRGAEPAQWNGAHVSDAESIVVPWLRTELSTLNVAALCGDSCGLQRYLERVWYLRFPDADSPLYPGFIDALRRAIGTMLSRSAEAGRRLDQPSASNCFDEAWASVESDQHPHDAMYLEKGRQLLCDLAG